MPDTLRKRLVHTADVDARKRRVQLRAQRLHRVFGQAQRLDKVVAGAAAGEQQRKLAAGHAVDDLKERAVAADGDDARHLLFRRLPRVCARLGGAFGNKCAVRDAFAPQERLHAGLFLPAASIA